MVILELEMVQTAIRTAAGKQNHWAIVCPDSRVKGGLWGRWLTEKCVAIGWHPDTYRMHGSTKVSGWRLARKRIQEIVPGDIVVPYLRNYTFGVPGEVVRVAASDGEWLPTVPGNDTEYSLGRRIEVEWLEKEVPPFDKVAVVPKTMQRRGIVIRQAIERLNRERFARIKQIIRTPANWRPYQQVQANGGNSHSTPNSKAPLTLIEDAVSKDAEERIEREAGFQSNPKIRRAVELQAMQLVKLKFQKMGYEVRNHSSNNPYDLLCQRNKDVKYVEVKGTQTAGAAVVLTNGEVKFIEKNKPSCAICVVHGIKVSAGINPTASAGKICVYECAGLNLRELQPISFTLKFSV